MIAFQRARFRPAPDRASVAIGGAGERTVTHVRSRPTDGGWKILPRGRAYMPHGARQCREAQLVRARIRSPKSPPVIPHCPRLRPPDAAGLVSWCFACCRGCVECDETAGVRA